MSLSLIIILLSFLVSTVAFFRKGYPFHMKVFSWMLFFTIVAELIANWQASNGQNNLRTYNISTSLWAMMAAYIFYEIILFKKVKRVIRIFWVSYPLLIFLNIRYLQRADTLLTNTYAIGSLMIVFLAIAYFYELFHRPQSINLLRTSEFWICSGLLFYNATSLPFLVMINVVNSEKASPMIFLYFIIISLSNILQYPLFIIAFLCKIPIRKYISSLS